VDKTAAKSLTPQQNTVAAGCDNCKRSSERLQNILHLFMIHVGGIIARQVENYERVPRAVSKVAYLSSGVSPKLQACRTETAEIIQDLIEKVESNDIFDNIALQTD
jgi:hypothetical protein